MKAFLKWTAIIFLSVISVFIYRAYQDRNDGVLEEMTKETETISTTTKENVDEDLVQKSKEWLTYENAEYLFSIDYPENWEAQEKPTKDYAIYEVNIHKKEYETYRPDFIIQVFERDLNQSVLDWWKTWLTIEEGKKQECIDENGEDSPCLSLRDMVDFEEDTEIMGEEAHKVQLFQFDHQEECIYLAKNKYIYGLCYDSSNSNDPNFKENKIIAEEILKSFIFTIEDLNLDTGSTTLQRGEVEG